MHASLPSIHSLSTVLMSVDMLPISWACWVFLLSLSSPRREATTNTEPMPKGLVMPMRSMRNMMAKREQRSTNKANKPDTESEAEATNLQVKEGGCTCCEDKDDLSVSSSSNDQQQSPEPVDPGKLGAEQIVFVEKSSDLEAINDDTIQLAVWRRPKLPAFAPVLLDSSLTDPSSLPTFEGLVTPSDAAERLLLPMLGPPYKLRSRFGKSQKKKRPLSDDDTLALITEISSLVSIFSDLTKSPVIHVKLSVVTDDGCAFWHQDCVDYRLVTTYRGPCTEYVLPAYSKETLSRRKYHSKWSQSLRQGDVAIFKGRGETDETDELLDHPGIVHRSPRIEEGSGDFRLVLVLDIPREGWHY